MKVNKTFWLNYFRPTYFYEDISKIDIDKLYNDGIRCIFCDLDNTLAPHFSKYPLKMTINFINKIKSKGMRFFIFSNNREKRVKDFMEKLDQFCKIDGFLYNTKKPFLRKTKKFMRANNVSTYETIVIGDQFITDIFIANRFMMNSILVTPLLDVTIGNVNFIQRMIEKYIYKNIRLNILKEEVNDEECELL